MCTNVSTKFLASLLLLICSTYVLGNEETQGHRGKRSMLPKLEMTVTYWNVTPMMHPGSTYFYRVNIKHHKDSTGDAMGTKVLFILSPFITFKELKSYAIVKPTPIVEDNSVTMKMNDVIWSSEPSFEFVVTFDDESTLMAGKHHVVTHAQITYYNQYAEDANGLVTSKGDFYKLPLHSMKFDVEIPGCSKPLGMKSKEIKDYQVGASSSYAEAQPSQARQFDEGWCAHSSNVDQYLQIDFTDAKRITGLSTIRRQSKPHWVTEYYIMYTLDGEEWRDYIENGFTKRFSGNSISYDPVTHWLANPFQAISIRIRPTKWEVLICLRLELFGCTIKGSAINCMQPLGMESGVITDEALSDKRTVVNEGDMVQPRNARINTPVDKFPHGWMSDTNSVYLQVDLGSVHQVTRVAIQGAHTSTTSTLFFTKSYKLSYSNNSMDWIEYSENGQVKTLVGSMDRFAAKYPKIVSLNPIAARYVRFYPLMAGDAGWKVMRAELYGCLKDPEPLYKGITDLQYFRRSFLVDPTTDQFIVCMYTDKRAESSCFATNDSKSWRAIDPNIITILAANPHNREVYALDRLMNLHRTQDSGVTWYQISRQYYDLAAKASTFYKAKGILDNFVSGLPTPNTTISTSKGAKWGVSSGNIHYMTAGTNTWTIVGSWKCCGM